MKKDRNARNPAANIIFLIFALFACLFLAGNLLSQAVDDIRVRAVSNAGKSRVGIGERFIYSTIISSSHDIEVDMPKEDKIGSFEIKDRGVVRQGSLTGHRVKIWHELVVYETGEKVIPALKINYRFGQGQWHSIESNAVNIYVQSVFERSKIEADIRPIEPPVGLRFPYTFHIIAGIPVLFIVFYSAVFFIKYRKRMLEKKRRGPARNLRVYRKLSDKAALLNTKTEFKTYDFTGLSGLIREYLGLNFHMDYTRFTTEEFLSKISSHSDFYVKYGEDLSFLLRASDMVKFANYIPGAEDYKRAFLLTRSIIKDIPPNESQE
jgi:hypothetical protein